MFFNVLTLKQVFWQTKAFFAKTEVPFLVESTTIESATFPYKTDLSKANVNMDWHGEGRGSFFGALVTVIPQ